MTTIKNTFKVVGYALSSTLGYFGVGFIVTFLIFPFLVVNDTRKYYKQLKGTNQ